MYRHSPFLIIPYACEERAAYGYPFGSFYRGLEATFASHGAGNRRSAVTDRTNKYGAVCRLCSDALALEVPEATITSIPRNGA